MRVRALDGNHDFTFGSGRSNYLQNNAAIAQNTNTRLSSFLGDCFYDLGAGIDWFNLLGAKDQTAVKLAVSSTILNTEGVTGIQEISFGLNAKRQFSVSYTEQTVYSTTSSVFTFDNTVG